MSQPPNAPEPTEPAIEEPIEEPIPGTEKKKKKGLLALISGKGLYYVTDFAPTPIDDFYLQIRDDRLVAFDKDGNEYPVKYEKGRYTVTVGDKTYTFVLARHDLVRDTTAMSISMVKENIPLEEANRILGEAEESIEDKRAEEMEKERKEQEKKEREKQEEQRREEEKKEEEKREQEVKEEERREEEVKEEQEISDTISKVSRQLLIDAASISAFVMIYETVTSILVGAGYTYGIDASPRKILENTTGIYSSDVIKAVKEQNLEKAVALAVKNFESRLRLMGAERAANMLASYREYLRSGSSSTTPYMERCRKFAEVVASISLASILHLTNPDLPGLEKTRIIAWSNALLGSLATAEQTGRLDEVIDAWIGERSDPAINTIKKSVNRALLLYSQKNAKISDMSRHILSKIDKYLVEKKELEKEKEAVATASATT